jgi:RNA polymerase sigma-70 factor (ECF subfamily)
MEEPHRSGKTWARYTAGSGEDFDRLYQETHHRVVATLATLLRDREAAEDCAQEAYLRAFQAWARWRDDGPAEAWVHRIAINVAVTTRRRERLRQMGEMILHLGQPRVADPTDTRVPELVRELRALPSRQAAALVLRYLHGYSNREIAQALGVPERTVASRLAAGLRRLRERLSASAEPAVYPQRVEER